MTTSLAGRLRRLWLDVHLWIGVGLLVVFIPLGVSGSALVWHDGLDKLLHPARYATSGPGPALPPETYAQAAAAAFNGRATLSQVRLPETAGDPVVATGRLTGPPGPGGRPRSLNVWIDPASAKLLDVADSNSGLVRVMHQLHGTLFIPEVGRKVVGWLGWAMFVSTATGLWLWWPRNGAVLRALRWRRGPSTLFNLHHMVGFWICLPLAVLSLTGVYISFPQASRALFGVAEAPARPGGQGMGAGGGRFAPPLPHPQLSLGAAAQAALAANPGAELASISLPTRGKAPAWRVQLRKSGAPVTVQVTDATGELKPDRGGPGGAPDPLSRWMRRLHDGADMGLVWQSVIFLSGAAPAVLSLTGLVMWLRRRSRRRALIPGLAAA
jgi:uncharacterized iron-regulated membrane protein